jgi:oxepin-CoA hydrolase/3-oxo-5,6-dehydrosuberyl-CoA semialdehyde dehydrogenase
VVGDPAVEGVKMGALASRAQQADVAERVALLRRAPRVVCGAGSGAAFAPVGEGTGAGAFFPPTLLLCRDAARPRRRARRREPSAR